REYVHALFVHNMLFLYTATAIHEFVNLSLHDALPISVMLTRLAALSMSTDETDDCFKRSSKNSLILISSCKRSAQSFSANHFDSQSLMIPTRRPIGFIF